jgi:hypothetical protein
MKSRAYQFEKKKLNVCVEEVIYEKRVNNKEIKFMYWVQVSTRTSAILNEVLSGYPKSLRANAGIVGRARCLPNSFHSLSRVVCTIA